MSSVFISNVDDYLAPSQACVNPLFADNTNNETKQQEKKHMDDAGTAVVVPRKRRVVRKKRAIITNTEPSPVIPLTPAKVTMADCLACSGCVTTAETVLVEQHSLSTLKQAIQDDSSHIQETVFTLSPASYGDIVRKLETTPSLSLKRKLTTFLSKTTRRASVVVLDGRVALEWSLQEAAMEFCHAFRHRHLQSSTIPSPSVALSNTRIQYIHDGRGVVDCSTTAYSASRIPLLTSSCPALVCLVEKSTPAAVPHLSTTKSPMSIAGAYVSCRQKDVFHVAIMPCHDKKLEASRKDLQQDSTGKPDVDLVITTQELWTLLCEATKSEDSKEVLQYLEGLDMSDVSIGVTDDAGLARSDDDSQSCAVLVVPHQSNDDKDVEMMDVTNDDSQSQQSQDFYSYGSGGYADYIFRFASRHLFGYDIPSEERLPWTPVGSTVAAQGRRVVSARVAASAKRRRDFHQVTLYRNAETGLYSCLKASPHDAPVLRFATAYGLQNIQRVLQYAPFSTATTASPLPFDYVEAMACPSGCPNGGGQIRFSTEMRETPTETRERVLQTTKVMKQDEMDYCSDNAVDFPTNLCPSGPFGEESKRLLHTRFHVVPPLQHTMGAAAGVAVQDTQW